jgi:hypothetical protein
MENTRFTADFTAVTSEGDTLEVPTMVKTYHSLAKFILRNYLASQLYPFTNKGKVQFMIDVIESQEHDYSLSSCVKPLSVAVVSNYNIYKKKGTLPINTRETKQLAYIIEKSLIASINHYK